MDKNTDLFSAELDALLANHGRMEGRYPFETFPYDQKSAIIEWLRTHDLSDLAEAVEESAPNVVAACVAGYRWWFKREEAFWKAYTSLTEGK